MKKNRRNFLKLLIFTSGAFIFGKFFDKLISSLGLTKDELKIGNGSPGQTFQEFDVSYKNDKKELVISDKKGEDLLIIEQ